MSILVDSSVWIDYFRTPSGQDHEIDFLIDHNLLSTNDLILAEILPALTFRRQHKLTGLFQEIRKTPMSIEWDGLIELQLACLNNGVNRVGLPDLMIAQHAIQNRLALFTLDRHSTLIAELTELELY